MDQKISFKYGLILFGSLTGFFLLMWIFNQADKTWLRVFNGLIHITLLYFAIKQYRRKSPETFGNYLSGVSVGLYTSVIGSLLFAAFIALFTSFNVGFEQSLTSAIPYDLGFIPLSAALFVIMEGIVAGLIGSYVVTRLINMQILNEKTGKVNRNSNYENNAGVATP